MQDCRSHFATPLSRRFSFHGNLRSLRLRRGLCETDAVRSSQDIEYFRPGSEPIRRSPRKLWHHDQAVSGRTRRRKRSCIRRTRGAGVDRRGANFGSRSGFLPRVRRIVRSRGNNGSPGKTVELRIPRNFHKALPLRLTRSSGHDRAHAPDRSQQHPGTSSGQGRGRRKSQYDHDTTSP